MIRSSMQMKTTRTITLAELQGPGVYLLHLQQPYTGRPSRPCLHYLGFAKVLGERITRHAQGKGSCFTRAVHAAGIGFEVAALWPHATRRDERALKRRHRHAQLCPICRSAGAGSSPASVVVSEQMADPKGGAA